MNRTLCGFGAKCINMRGSFACECPIERTGNTCEKGENFVACCGVLLIYLYFFVFNPLRSKV